MKKVLIKNATLVNEGKITHADVLIIGERIDKIAPSFALPAPADIEINAEGLYLLPGIIDAHVHFRQPGLTHKGNIATESAAAVAGGITSFMDMPNTVPNTLSLELLEEKFNLASQSSFANFSFFMGVTKDNLEEALKVDSQKVCGLSDDGLYFDSQHGLLANNPDYLEKLFSRAQTLVSLHCEDDVIINANIQKYKALLGEQIPESHHPLIRSEEACVMATKRVLEIAKKHNTRFHLLHVSTLAETQLLEKKVPIGNKRITAEVCVHHLWFTDQDYARLGARIKWNPAIKTAKDRDGLLKALQDNQLDIVATDHAPHTVSEKSGDYFHARPGGPLVQHALPAMLGLCWQGKISLPKVVEKMSHHVAAIYRIKDRGYIREGYFADLVLVDMNKPRSVTARDLLYGCQWSPFSGEIFQSRIIHTFVNGNWVYKNGLFSDSVKGQRLLFEKIR